MRFKQEQRRQERGIHVSMLNGLFNISIASKGTYSQKIRRDLPRVSRKTHKPRRGMPRHRQPTSRITTPSCKKGKTGDSSADDGDRHPQRENHEKHSSLNKFLEMLVMASLRLETILEHIITFLEIIQNIVF